MTRRLRALALAARYDERPAGRDGRPVPPSRRPSSIPRTCPAAPTSRSRTWTGRRSSTATGGSRSRPAASPCIGRSGRSFILGTSRRSGLGPYRVLRLRPDDSLRPLLRASPWSLTLSEDGSRLVHLRTGTRRSSPVRVHSARTGALLAERGFPDYPDVLGMEGRRVLMSTWERGVSWWDTGSGRTSLVTRRPAGTADVGHDLLATYTDDPYRDGCTVLSRLSRPGKVLWRSCTERVDEFGPDGRSMATIHILSDGVGPGRITLRSVRGVLRARYDAAQWFGAVRWEDPDTRAARHQRHAVRSSALPAHRLRERHRPRARDRAAVGAPSGAAGPAQNISVAKRADCSKPTRAYAARAGEFHSLT